jgi:hypothetical protein
LEQNEARTGAEWDLQQTTVIFMRDNHIGVEGSSSSSIQEP